MMRGVLIASGVVAAVGCSSNNATPAGGGNGKNDGGTTLGDGGGGTFVDSGTTIGADGCTEAARLVYTVTEDNVLYSFSPATLTFKVVGTLKCSAAANPNSMAVDRSGTAWVNYSDGSLFKVSTADASCSPTTFVAGQHGFGRFGMAFASNSPGSKDETLFVCGLPTVGFDGHGLARIDTTTLALTTIGDFTNGLTNESAELTGTGDGRLYGFFPSNPASLAEIDKATAATPTSKSLTNVYSGTDWAMSFWGGDFWFYTADSKTLQFSTTSVTQLTTADGSLAIRKNNVGFRVVGAGVSTCAPLAPPK